MTDKMHQVMMRLTAPEIAALDDVVGTGAFALPRNAALRTFVAHGIAATRALMSAHGLTSQQALATLAAGGGPIAPVQAPVAHKPLATVACPVTVASTAPVPNRPAPALPDDRQNRPADIPGRD